MHSDMAGNAPGAITRQTGRRVCLFDSGLFGPLYENIMSSTKPEVHNLLHFCQRRFEPQLRGNLSENCVKFSCVVSELCEWTDRQTNKHTDTLIQICVFLCLSVCLSVSLFLMHGRSFERIWTKFGTWHCYTLAPDGHGSVSERRSRP